jgi:hypothetical protein
VVVIECDQREDRERSAAVFEGWRCSALLCAGRRRWSRFAIFCPGAFRLTLGLFGEAPEEKWLRTRREIPSEILFLSLNFYIDDF